MNVILWVLQILFGVYWISLAVLHFTVPPGLPAPMAWMYELPPILHYLSGTAEILGGLGLILPAVTRIQTRMVPLAATGLVLVMIGAAIYHLTRGEIANIGQNVFLAAISAFIAYGRWQLKPLRARQAG